MGRIAIVVGHARTGTYCEALGEAYQRGAQSAGHTADLIVTSQLSFDPILHEGFERVQPLEPDLQAAHDLLFAADHLVIIFPLWLGGMPAILKGFLERVLQPAIQPHAKAGKFTKPLAGKSARIIITMGMPGFVYRWWFGAHALKMLKRNILSFVGVGPIRATVLGNVEGVGTEGRARWLKEIEERGHAGN